MIKIASGVVNEIHVWKASELDDVPMQEDCDRQGEVRYVMEDEYLLLALELLADNRRTMFVAGIYIYIYIYVGVCWS